MHSRPPSERLQTRARSWGMGGGQTPAPVGNAKSVMVGEWSCLIPECSLRCSRGQNRLELQLTPPGRRGLPRCPGIYIILDNFSAREKITVGRAVSPGAAYPLLNHSQDWPDQQGHGLKYLGRLPPRDYIPSLELIPPKAPPLKENLGFPPEETSCSLTRQGSQHLGTYTRTIFNTAFLPLMCIISSGK